MELVLEHILETFEVLGTFWLVVVKMRKFWLLENLLLEPAVFASDFVNGLLDEPGLTILH